MGRPEESVPAKANRWWLWTSLLLFGAIASVRWAIVYKRTAFDPALVIVNNGPAPLTNVRYRDARPARYGEPSSANRWDQILPGERVVHGLHGDDFITLTFELRGQEFRYEQYWPGGPFEAWVVSIGPQGEIDAKFARARTFR